MSVIGLSYRVLVFLSKIGLDRWKCPNGVMVAIDGLASPFLDIKSHQEVF